MIWDDRAAPGLAKTAEFEGLIKTSLFQLHTQLGARIVPFAGWALPLEFAGTVSEHEAVRKDVGVFDVSHLGTVFVEGDGAEAAIAEAFTNDPSRLGVGESQYTLCCDEKGGIVDDLIVYRLAADGFIVVPNAANTAAVLDALNETGQANGARVRDESVHYAILAVQGPRSLELMDRLFPNVLHRVPYRGIGRIDFGPGDTGWLCRTGYTGEVGAEVILSGLDAPGIFRELLDLGAVACGLGARDTLRLEMGYPLHGNDLTRDTDPFEAGLDWAVKLDHGAFRGQEALRAKKEEGPRRRLRGLVAVAKGSIPRHGMTVRREGDRVGEVTSGSFSPTLRRGIALAYLDTSVELGDQVTVDIRTREPGFEVVAPPFVHRDPRGRS